MADRQLVAEVIINAKGAEETIKRVEKMGNQMVTTITRGNEVIRQSITTTYAQTRGAAIQANTAMSALASTYSATVLVTGAVVNATRGLVDFLRQSAEAAWADEASVKARNAALLTLEGTTISNVQALDKQVEKYQLLYGISDDVTRGIQQQLAEYRLAPAAIEAATDAIQAQGIKAVALTKFLQGQTDTIKGTTIAVDENATAHDRLAAVIEGTRPAMEALESRLGTGQNAANNLKDAWSELQEVIGQGFNTQAAISGMNKLALAMRGMAMAGSAAARASAMVNFAYGIGGAIDFSSPFTAGRDIIGGMLDPLGFGKKIHESAQDNPAYGAAMSIVGMADRLETMMNMPNSGGDVAAASGGGGGGGGKSKAKPGRSAPLSSSLWGSSPEELLGIDIADRLRGRARSLIDDGIEPLRETINRLNSSMAQASNVFQGFAWASGGGVGAANARANALIGGVFSGGTSGLSWSSNTLAATKARANAVIAAAMAGGGGWGDGGNGIQRGGLRKMLFEEGGQMALFNSLASGGGSGFASTAGGLLGGAATAGLGGFLGSAGGPIGALLGGGIFRTFKGLFGGGKKDDDRGLVPGKPIYVEDVTQIDELRQLNDSLRKFIMGGAGGPDRALTNFRLQNARAGNG